jgi:hypothetical protein
VEVRVDGNVGVGRGSSLGIFLKELRVDDLPRMPSLERVGEDLLEALDPCRKRGTPGTPEELNRFFARALLCDGDGRGEASASWIAISSVEAERRAFTAGDSVPGIRVELAEARETVRCD